MNVIFVTGGARSGKSTYAESLLSGKDNVLYIATSIPIDEEMARRIELHRERRNPNWITIEAFREIDRKVVFFLKQSEYILLDCLTVMIANIMFSDGKIDWDKAGIKEAEKIEEVIEKELDNFFESVRNFKGKIIIVSNELGMGLVPSSPMGRFFRDIAGRMNQKVAALSKEVYLIVSGIPLKIKG